MHTKLLQTYIVATAYGGFPPYNNHGATSATLLLRHAYCKVQRVNSRKKLPRSDGIEIILQVLFTENRVLPGTLTLPLPFYLCSTTQ